MLAHLILSTMPTTAFDFTKSPEVRQETARHDCKVPIKSGFPQLFTAFHSKKVQVLAENLEALALPQGAPKAARIM